MHLRDGACEVDGGQIPTGGDGLPKDRPVRRHKVDHAVREARLLEDLVDEIVGEHGRVARLPHRHVALYEEREESGFNEKSRTSENVRFNFVNALANIVENTKKCSIHKVK